jgi:site-specific DNA recombinase
MRTAAIYARVSSEKQKEEQTIGSQREALKEYAKIQGYVIPDEWNFEDEGYSGASLQRPGLERLRDLSVEGQLEIILVYSPDRLSRKYAYQVLLLEEFSRCGVEVIFIKSPQATTPEEELLVQFQGMIAEYERTQIVERTRRGKKHKAKNGTVSVLSGAPYGYRYVKKTDNSEAYYEVNETEANIVREVYRLYTQEWLSMGEIVRRLTQQKIPTRNGKSRWDRSVVWSMLRNPSYKGKACYGKTEKAERQKITRPLRQRGGFTKRSSCNRERPKNEWIEIDVPMIINEETFALAAERLEKNKQFSRRHTKEPTLLQGILVCNECGYGVYRTSTRTSKRKIYYYRCLGSDDYRYANGRVCNNRPIRADYLDERVWREVMKLLEDPNLIKTEMERRMKEARESNPTKRRGETLVKEATRLSKGIDRLLDAYQEGLMPLEQLRGRIRGMRKREQAIKSELQSLEAQAIDEQSYRQVVDKVENFLGKIHESAKMLSVEDRQKVLRLVVKEILVGPKTLIIKHSIPTGGVDFRERSGTSEGNITPSYLLCRGSLVTIVIEPLPQ